MVTLHGTDLIAIALVLGVGFAVSCALLLRRVKALVNESQLKIGDQLGVLNDAIRTMETRLAEHAAQRSGSGTPKGEVISHSATGNSEGDSSEIEESGEIALEIRAAIAAAAVATLGPNAVVHSVKPALSPWSQQGRVMAQGGHNLRVRG